VEISGNKQEIGKKYDPKALNAWRWGIISTNGGGESGESTKGEHK
jgi:hypothetical protein